VTKILLHSKPDFSRLALPNLERPIALVGPHPPYRGGIAHFTERLTDEIRAQGRPVLPVSFRRMYPGILFPGRSQYEPDGATVRTVAHEWVDSVMPTSWSRTAREIADSGADTAIFMYWMPFFSPAFTRIARRLSQRGIPSLAVVHNAIPHERHPADAFLTARFLRACRTLVALSDIVAGDVQSLAPQTHLRLLYHPVYDRFGEALDRSEARKRLNIPADANVLLFFGNVRRYKGLDVLIDALPEAIRRAPRILALVAGEFYEDVENYRSRIRERDVTDYVRIDDRYIPTEDVAAYFSAADVVVHPYRSATQSGVVRTAQSFEVPVIGTDVGGLAADIGSGGVVVTSEDPVELGRAIADYFNEERKLELQENVRRNRGRSSWQGFATAVLEEVDRLRQPGERN